MSYNCPHCGAVIYSRRNPLCGICEKELPPELLFTAGERAKWDLEMARWRSARSAASLGSFGADAYPGGYDGGYSCGFDGGGCDGGGGGCDGGC
jgi:hypothetical protein